MSWLLASGGGDAREIVTETLPVVAKLLDARAVVLVSDHPALGGAARFTAPHPAGPGPLPADHADTLAEHVHAAAADQLPTGVLRHLPELGAALLVVPLPRHGQPCGSLAALVPDPIRTDGSDLAILGTVGNQLAGAIESAYRLERSRTHNHMLRETRHELVAAREREVLAEERQRIARDLHDSVAQHVLSMGMQVETTRLASDDPDTVARLTEIKSLARTTVDRIRTAIFALGDTDELSPGLVGALRRLGEQHQVHGLAIGVRVVGPPVGLPGCVERALYGAAKEALFNSVVHAEATRASVHLAYEPEQVRLVVTDNGAGRAAELRAALESARRGPHSGYHRGLGNIDDRVRVVGGRLRITDARGGGVRLQVEVPVGADD
jgi:signal transduction histidine kinase